MKNHFTALFKLILPLFWLISMTLDENTIEDLIFAAATVTFFSALTIVYEPLEIKDMLSKK